MVTPELVAYVRQQIAQGVNQDALERALLAQGWGLEDVMAAVREASGAVAPAAPPAPATTTVTVSVTQRNDAGFSAGTFQQQYPLSPKKFWKKMLTGNTSSSQSYAYRRKSLPVPFSLFLILLAAFLAFGGSFLTPATGVTPASEQFSSYLELAAFGVLALFVLYIIGKAWYVSSYIRKYFYDVAPDAVTIRKGVFTPQEIHVLWNKVQDVYVDQDIFDRMLGLYDVHLASATMTSGMEAHIDGVSAETAEALKNYLLSRISNNGGASQPAAASAATAALPAAQIQGISSDTYPIVGRWVALQAITSMLVAAFLTFLVVVTLVLGGSNSNGPGVVTQLGFSSAATFWLSVGVFVVISVLFFIYQLLWRSSFHFALGPEYITKNEGVIARSEKHVPYRTVQDVLVSQSIFERMLGIGHVTIQNAAQSGAGVSGSLVIPGQPIAKANELSSTLRKIIFSSNPSQTGV